MTNHLVPVNPADRDQDDKTPTERFVTDRFMRNRWLLMGQKS